LRKYGYFRAGIPEAITFNSMPKSMIPKTFTFLKTTLIVLAVLLAMPLFAQKNMELAVENIKQGDIAFSSQKYQKAIKFYKDALAIEDSLTIAYWGLGQSYMLINEHQNALNSYLKIIERSPKFSRMVYYLIAEMYYKVGKPSRAIGYYEQFLKLQQIDDGSFTLAGDHEVAMEAEALAKTPGAIQSCVKSLDPKNNLMQDARVFNLGPAINDKHDQYFPCLSNDQNILYYTRMSATGRDEDLYVSTKTPSGGWRIGVPANNIFNSKLDEGMTTLVRDGRRMFFTACKRDGVMGGCDIWEAIVDGMEVKEVNAIEGHPNSEKWESQAAISCDGQTLFFSSTREGGLGGADLWFSKKNIDGTWSEPKNLGPRINTPQDEESPFISNDGQTLFFTSTGHPSFGDQDIYMSVLDPQGRWAEPSNLGPKINSPFTERCFFLSADGKNGYFASNRPEGQGGMDIYLIKFAEAIRSRPITFVEGLVKDATTEVGVSTIVYITGREPIKTDIDGRFFICMPSNNNLDVKVRESGYHPYEHQYTIPEWENNKFYTLEIRLDPLEAKKVSTKTAKTPNPPPVIDTSSTAIPPRIRKNQRQNHTIIFRFDSDELEADELEKFVDFIAKINVKDIQRVEINGYADDIGDDRYNLELSEKRAKKIASMLFQRGYPINRIDMRGLGELRDGKEKKQNRKVELKILSLE
jgi:outer membrane protein OmpA-like peptidoglycan-associated protein/Tol biopolymer transport system component